MTSNFSSLTQKVVSSYLLSTSQRKTLEDDLKSLAAAFEAAAEHIDNQADKLLYGPRQKALEQAVWVLMHVVNELKSSAGKEGQPRRLLWELMQEKAAPYSHPSSICWERSTLASLISKTAWQMPNGSMSPVR